MLESIQTVGDWIQAKRREKNLTRGHVAAKMGMATALVRVHGRTAPRKTGSRQSEALASLLGFDPGYDAAENRTTEQIGTGNSGPVAMSSSSYNSDNQMTSRTVSSGAMLFAGSVSKQATVTVAGRRRKGDAEKVKIALRLRRESIMTLKWIARRLQMGSWTNVANCLAKTK